jgi:hypothetical protein
MALDWSIGLHAICVRVELDIGHKDRSPKKGVSFRIHGLYVWVRSLCGVCWWLWSVDLVELPLCEFSDR